MSKVYLEGKFFEEDENGLVTIEISVDDALEEIDDWDIKYYARHELDMFEDIDEFEDEALIEQLEESGYVVKEQENTPELDYTDQKMLDDIISKFHNSCVFEREKIYKKVFSKEAKQLDDILSKYNDYDIFNYLDRESFDFLNCIDTQEIIEHINEVGYKVIEK